MLGSLAVAWPLVARAQQIPKPARLGYIWIGAKDSEELHPARVEHNHRAKKTDVEHGKRSNYQARTENQHTQRASTGVSTICPACSCIKLLPGIQRPRGSHAGRLFGTNCRSARVPFIT